MKLVIKGDKDFYSFGYLKDGKFVLIHKLKTALFSVEVSSSPFINVTYGPFVKGMKSLGGVQRFYN